MQEGPSSWPSKGAGDGALPSLQHRNSPQWSPTMGHGLGCLLRSWGGERRHDKMEMRRQMRQNGKREDDEKIDDGN